MLPNNRARPSLANEQYLGIFQNAMRQDKKGILKSLCVHSTCVKLAIKACQSRPVVKALWRRGEHECIVDYYQHLDTTRLSSPLSRLSYSEGKKRTPLSSSSSDSRPRLFQGQDHLRKKAFVRSSQLLVWKQRRRFLFRYTLC